MKRINILLSKHTLGTAIAYILALGIAPSLVIFGLFATPEDEFMFPYALGAFLALALVPLLLQFRNLPLYLEYDREKIVAHYPFGKTATVWKSKTIYISSYRYYRSGYHTVLSNTAFPVNISENARTTVKRLDYNTQILLPEDEFPELSSIYRKSACIPAENADWDVLVDQYKDETALYADEKRIYILPGFLVALLKIEFGIIIAAGVFLFFIFSEGLAYTIMILLYSALGWGYGIYRIVDAIRNLHFCGTVSFSDTSVTSRLFKKEQCTVDLAQPIYYAVFRGAEYGSKGKPYIAVSNQWFNYFKVNRDDRSYLSEYDRDTQAAFPYNAETAPYCDFDNWHCVGGFGELNLRQQSN